jgi:hypothetical protein
MGKVIDLASKRKSKVTHEQKIVLYTLKVYTDLYQKGVVPAPNINITEAGYKDIENFTATNDELRVGMQYLKEEGVIPNVGSDNL